MHWNVRAILGAVVLSSEAAVRFTDEDLRSAGASLPAGCISLLRSLIDLDEHFSFGQSERLDALKQRARSIRDQIEAAINRVANQA